MLKEPDYLIFDEVKAQTLANLKAEQLTMNPAPYVKAVQPSAPVKAPAAAAAGSAPAGAPAAEA